MAALLIGPWVHPAARALPLGAFTAWATQPGGTGTVQLVRGVIESLTACSPGTTVVVGVDDVHLLDDLSTFVVHQIVQRGAAKLVLTVRDGEAMPAGIQELWKAGQFDRLDLQPLSADDTTALLSASLDGSVDSYAARRLWELTRGNVLYLRHIVEQELWDGRLENELGYWRWIGDPTMPCSLVELIESRIGALPTAVGAVIDALDLRPRRWTPRLQMCTPLRTAPRFGSAMLGPELIRSQSSITLRSNTIVEKRSDPGCTRDRTATRWPSLRPAVGRPSHPRHAPG